MADFVKRQCEPLRRQQRDLARRLKESETDMKRLRKEVEYHATSGDAYVARCKAEQLVHARRDFKRLGEDLRHVVHFLALYRGQGSAVALDRGLVGITRLMEVRSRTLSPEVYQTLVQSYGAMEKSLTRQGPAIAFYDDRPAEAALDARTEATGLEDDVRAVFAELHLESLLPPPQSEPRAAPMPPVSAVPSLAMSKDGNASPPSPPPSPPPQPQVSPPPSSSSESISDQLDRRLAALRK